MQPIHTAASSGQAEVVIELVKQFKVDPREKADVYYNHCENRHSLQLFLGRFTAVAPCYLQWSN